MEELKPNISWCREEIFMLCSCSWGDKWNRVSQDRFSSFIAYRWSRRFCVPLAILAPSRYVGVQKNVSCQWRITHNWGTWGWYSQSEYVFWTSVAERPVWNIQIFTLPWLILCQMWVFSNLKLWKCLSASELQNNDHVPFLENNFLLTKTTLAPNPSRPTFHRSLCS